MQQQRDTSGNQATTTTTSAAQNLTGYQQFITTLAKNRYLEVQLAFIAQTQVSFAELQQKQVRPWHSLTQVEQQPYLEDAKVDAVNLLARIVQDKPQPMTGIAQNS